MRSAEKILGIIRERGQRGLPLEDIYRQLYNPTLYLMAYARLYSNEGAMTRGTTSETVDGMAYSPRGPRSQSSRSSPRSGKLSTWRRGIGSQDMNTRRYA
jgi:hypothetical protein